MNFDFLKGLRGLDEVYGPCMDAEELLRSKPYWSMAASRKGAEMLARFIYMAAHYKAEENLTFFDILRDSQVLNFIRDRTVIQEFHHIRKTGNTVVHGDQSELCQDEALVVLEELHHIAGETAKRLRLIDSYPVFSENIAENPDARLHEDAVINEKAKAMFLEYVIEERNKHKVFFDDTNEGHMDYFSKGIVIMHEYLEFSRPANMKTTIEYLKEYVSYILSADAALKTDEYDKDAPWNDLYAAVSLNVDGEVYSFEKKKSSAGEVPDIILRGLEALDSANSFSIDIHADGILRGFYYDVVDQKTGQSVRMIDEDSPWMGHGMADYLESARRREKFTYKGAFVFNTHNYDSEIYYIKDGKSYDVESICSPDIVNDSKGIEWTGSSIILAVDYDGDAYPDITEKLHEAVRAHVPTDQLPYIEDVWEEGESGVLLNGTDWVTKDLQQVQNFLDDVNRILEPIAEECDFSTEHCWYNLDEFSVAYIQMMDGRLRISGIKL